MTVKAYAFAYTKKRFIFIKYMPQDPVDFLRFTGFLLVA